MAHDSSGVTSLDGHECWALIRAADVGRLAVVVDGGPDIFPINFVVDHGTVVFRTAEGSKLAAATRGESVAFEVDGYALDDRLAWSVVVKGRAEEIRQMHELFDAGTLPLFAWHTAPKQHFVRIVPAAVTGRRFTVPAAPSLSSAKDQLSVRRAAHE